MVEKNISNNSNNILNTGCYTKIHSLDFIKLTALASAAYLTGEINKEENILNMFKKSVFSDIEENNIKIKNMKFLTNFSDILSILETDFEIEGQKPLTVISIKGTSTEFDKLLDFEMFISSAILTIARTFPILYKLESAASDAFNFINILPFKFLGKLTLTKKYIEKIDLLLKELFKKEGYGFKERNYIIVGHSLGGGLAKYTAFKYKLQGFSISGPGLTPLEFNYGKNKDKDNNYTKYFKNTFIDLIPDLDIVPRVEVSGGSRYRVLCEKGIFSCHNIKRTLCMLGSMCEKEHLTGNLCSGVYSQEEYFNDFTLVKNKNYF